MKGKVWIFSVPHTGTRFVKKMLQEKGFEAQEVHFNGQYQPLIWSEKDQPGHYVVVPRRKREDTEASWKRRGRDDYDLDKLWQELEEYVEDYDPHQVHIDDPERRIQDLQDLEDYLGESFDPNWDEKVGHFPPNQL